MADDDKDEKPNVGDKLMADTDNTPNYGTDGTDAEDSVRIDTTKPANDESMVTKNRPSLMNRIRSFDAQTASESHINCLQRFASLIFDTIIGIIALVITNIIQVACIIIGSVYVNDCPLSPGIPVILVVNGGINVLVCVMETVKRRINPNSNVIRRLDLILTCFKVASTVSFLIWILLVYDVPSPDYQDISALNYCNKTLYLFAFWLLSSLLILFAIILLFTCCCCCITGTIIASDKVDKMPEKPNDQV